MSRTSQQRTYARAECVVFRKTRETHGGLSNMAAGFLVEVNGITFSTIEALYQACRFPRFPDVQRLIIEQKSPMTAKMKSKRHREKTRADWGRVRVKIMRWCLRVKLAQNWEKFSHLLSATDGRAIVEESRKDFFWGARAVGDTTLVGCNALGRLLMELRQDISGCTGIKPSLLEVPPIPEFFLYGKSINPVIPRLRPSTDEFEMSGFER